MVAYASADILDFYLFCLVCLFSVLLSVFYVTNNCLNYKVLKTLTKFVFFHVVLSVLLSAGYLLIICCFHTKSDKVFLSFNSGFQVCHFSNSLFSFASGFCVSNGFCLISFGHDR